MALDTPADLTHAADADTNKPIDVLCMACTDASCDFKPSRFQRRPLGPCDILIDMKYCGVCHSDVVCAANQMPKMAPTVYPCVPGHELAGVCVAVGASVTKVKVGQQVGVGCMVDSCQECSACKSGNEQHCKKQVGTYNGKDNGSGRASTFPAGKRTMGGYTDKFVVDENFAIIIPDSYPLEFAGPIMCAGITMYDPMVKAKLNPGARVGIVGLGGLGQIGIKIAKALGYSVTVLSRSKNKESFAKECGADSFVMSEDAKEMKLHAKTLDILINTIPVYHKFYSYNSLLKKRAKQEILGLHDGIVAAHVLKSFTFSRANMKPSAIGGIKNTQKVMQLCAEHRIYPDIIVSPVQEINSIYEKMNYNPHGKRYVLDLEGSLNEKTLVSYPETPAPELAAHEMSSIFVGVKLALWLLFTGRW